MLHVVRVSTHARIQKIFVRVRGGPTLTTFFFFSFFFFFFFLFFFFFVFFFFFLVDDGRKDQNATIS